MKILHLSNSDGGGAGRAAHRLHQGLKNQGVESRILVQHKNTDDRAVVASQSYLEKAIAKLKISEYIDKLPLQLNRHHPQTDFTIEWFPENIASKVAQLAPDIVNLHWICHGFLQIETLSKFRQPIVWTLHDMWPFTGGCHYNQDCDRYAISCGACPQLDSSKDSDLSRWVWQRKAKAWKNLNLTIVTPSIWLAKCAKSSSLFKDLRVEVIPNGIDPQRYKPIDRQIAREILNLPRDKQLILFGAMSPTSDRRKGFYLLEEALQSLSKAGWADKVELVVFGASQPATPNDFGFKTHYLGRFSDEISLAIIYAAADAFVAPSVQDNLPNTVMEAIATGTPSVAFKIGGMPDLIEHEQNGYLADPFKTEDLAKGIAWVLEDAERHQKLCDRARQKTEQEFTQEIQARRYLSLFNDLLLPTNFSTKPGTIY